MASLICSFNAAIKLTRTLMSKTAFYHLTKPYLDQFFCYILLLFMPLIWNENAYYKFNDGIRRKQSVVFKYLPTF